jgi:hypothetical protein
MLYKPPPPPHTAGEANANTWYEFDLTATTNNNALTEFYSRNADWLSRADLIVITAPI